MYLVVGNSPASASVVRGPSRSVSRIVRRVGSAKALTVVGSGLAGATRSRRAAGCALDIGSYDDTLLLVIPPRIVRPPSLPALVYGRVCEQIADGSLKEGDRLPTEPELVNLFGVGRSSIREGIEALEMAGLVKVVRAKGTFVAEGAEHAITPFRWRQSPTAGVFADLLEARRLLETEMARLAAIRATSENIAAIKRTLTSQASGASDDGEDPGYSFHLKIAEAADNEVLLHMYKSIRDLYYEVYCGRHGDEKASARRIVQQQHHEILTAVTAREPERASEAMNAHIAALPTLYASSASHDGPRRGRHGPEGDGAALAARGGPSARQGSLDG